MFEPPPILFIGAPRSGTTVIFEQFALHPDLAWVSNYSKVFPRWKAVNLLRRVFDNKLINARGQKDQFNDVSFGNKWLPRPDESYPFWNAYACKDFDLRYLLGESASTAEREGLRSALASVRRYQGRQRVTAKLTGPGRIQYLSSIWPDLQVVHVIRDGLDVVRSLLNVPFWKNRGGYHTPWWQGGLDTDELARWESSGKDPGALAALQWRTIIDTTRQEAAEHLDDRYIELRYEDFLLDSVGKIHDIYDRFGLDTSRSTLQRLEPRNKKYSQNWDEEQLNALTAWMNPTHSELGYPISSAQDK